MPNLADYLLANRAGGNFGTMSPGEEAAAVTPGSVLDALAASAYRLGATPRDATRAGAVTPGPGGMVSDEDIARAQLSSGDVQDRASQLAMIMAGTPGGRGGLGAGARLPEESLIAADEGLPQTGARIGQPFNQTVTNPQRVAYPGIYKDPRQIALEAKAMVAPENPALKELFGVTRQDLYDISQGGRRAGTAEPVLGGAKNPKGSYVAENIMNQANAQRLIDANAEAERLAPELTRSMDAWYVMDPAYDRLAQISDNPNRRYSRFNTMTSMASPGSDVETEINRGTAAHMMAEKGRFEDFRRYGGTAAGARGADFPEELRDVLGHPYHSTSQALPMGNYLESGKVEMTSPKVPLYVQASEVPATGNQTRLPIPDAHFTRAIGAADVRKGAQPGVSMQMHEYSGGVGPWFRENVAGPLGIEAVPAQARTWGVFAPQTGVDTAIGAPKLELLAGRIARRARELGVDPALLRDAVLRGKAHAGIAGTAGAVGLGDLLLQSQRQQQ